MIVLIVNLLQLTLLNHSPTSTPIVNEKSIFAIAEWVNPPDVAKFFEFEGFSNVEKYRTLHEDKDSGVILHTKKLTWWRDISQSAECGKPVYCLEITTTMHRGRSRSLNTGSRYDCLIISL
jgi:hypothetical protein